MEAASGQPVLRSSSFIRWRRECIVSFLSVITVLRRFIIMAEALSVHGGWAYLSKSGASGSSPLPTGWILTLASGWSGTDPSEGAFFRRLQGVGIIWMHSSYVCQSMTRGPVTSASLAPVSRSS